MMGLETCDKASVLGNTSGDDKIGLERDSSDQAKDTAREGIMDTCDDLEARPSCL
jgi:hypothetical protein